MAERKTPSDRTSTSGSARSSARPSSASGSASAGGATRSTTSRPAGTTTSASGAGARPRKNAAPPPRNAGGKPPKRKPGKSIVNQKQTPWGLIAATVVVVLFAAAIVAVVVATSGSKHKSTATKQAGTTTHGGQAVNANDPYRHPELAAAKAIPGVTYKVEGEHNHVDGVIQYDSSPPVGGDHDALWADCDGNVYTHQIANENAVHMLEHGAVWITYNPKTLSKSGVTKLTKYVKGVDRTAMSPYAGLKTPISLQAWGYQLFLSNPSDPRIAQFIKALKYNPQTTPENASCTNPYFSASKSTLGHPQEIQ